MRSWILGRLRWRASLTEELEKKDAALRSADEERKKVMEMLDEEHARVEKASKSLETAKSTIDFVQSEKAKLMATLEQRQEDFDALNRSITKEKKDSLAAGTHLERKRWLKEVLPAKEEEIGESAVQRFVKSKFFAYLNTIRAYPEILSAYKRARSQLSFLGAIKEDVDTSGMALHLNNDLMPMMPKANEGTSGVVDFSKEEFFFAKEIIQAQVNAELDRLDEEEEEEEEGSGEEEQDDALSAPVGEVGDASADPLVTHGSWKGLEVAREESRYEEVATTGEQVNQGVVSSTGPVDGLMAVPSQDELFDAAEKEKK